AGDELDDNRYFAQAHRASAKIHMPIVVLSPSVSRQLQLTHLLRKPEPVSRVIERRDVPKAFEDPLRLARPRDPEQVAVSSENRAVQRTPIVMQRDHALALLGIEPAGED